MARFRLVKVNVLLSRLLMWLFCFGLSLLLEVFGWADQGKSFLIIYMCLSGVVVLCATFIVAEEEAPLVDPATVLAVGIAGYAAVFAGTLLVTWIVTKIFDVNFCTVFQLTSLAQCPFAFSRKEH